MKNYCRFLNFKDGTRLMIYEILEDFPALKGKENRDKLWQKVKDILHEACFVDGDELLYYLSDAENRIFQKDWGTNYGLQYF